MSLEERLKRTEDMVARMCVDVMLLTLFVQKLDRKVDTIMDVLTEAGDKAEEVLKKEEEDKEDSSDSSCEPEEVSAVVCVFRDLYTTADK